MWSIVERVLHDRKQLNKTSCAIRSAEEDSGAATFREEHSGVPRGRTRCGGLVLTARRPPAEGTYTVSHTRCVYVHTIKILPVRMKKTKLCFI